MSESEKHEEKEQNDASIYYILGGVVLVAAVAGFFLLKPKEKQVAPTAPAPAVVNVPPAATPTPAPITKFACEKQYYNPVLGFPKYFLSAEGVDISQTGDIECEFTVSIKDRVVATTTTNSPLVQSPERGGSIFHCQTKAVELAKGVATDVVVKAKNVSGETVSCKQSFVFP